MSTLIVAEHDGCRLKPEFLKVVNAAMGLGEDIDVLVTGYSCENIAYQVVELGPVHQVWLADDLLLEHQPEQLISHIIHKLAPDYRYVLCSSSVFGNAVLSGVAATLDVFLFSHVCGIVDTDTFKRPIYAGKFHQTIKSHDPVIIITIMTSAYVELVIGQSENPGVAVINKLDMGDLVKLEQPTCVSVKKNQSPRPDLQSARVVIGVGRGLRNVENFKMIETLADRLGAAIGATRAVVEAGWMSNDYQIGQTAKKIAPDLYIALGISGAAQHLAGMQDSRVIIAINKDPDAPIFKVTDYGLIADLNEVLPELRDSFGASI